jgi:hypothetical protein
MSIRISRRVVVSAAPFVFARTTIAAGANYRPDASVLPMLGSIADALDRATPIGGSFVHQPRFLGLLPTGQDGKRPLLLDCVLELDTDGWPGDGNNPN